jgi:hypothetical protein
MFPKGTLRTTGIFLGALAVTAPPAFFALKSWAGEPAARSAVLGGVLAAVLALAAVWLALWAFDKPSRTFLLALLGGFLGRMVVFGGSLAALILRTDLPPAAFLGGLFGYYVLFQILEIRAVQALARATKVRA